MTLLALTPAMNSVWTVVPAEVRVPPDLDNDELGGASEAQDAQLFGIIKSHLDTAPSNCAVFEHALAQPSDPTVVKSPIPWFGFEREVYYYLAGPGHDVARVRDLVSRAQTYRLTGFLTVAPPELIQTQLRAIDERIMQQLAARVTRVIALAWHMTGKVISDVTVDSTHSSVPGELRRTRKN